MVEVELKFQLPESKKKTVQQYLKKHKAKNIHLQAKYYDTPDRLLAKNGMALRLRKEDDQWVQTFKAAGQSHLHRVDSFLNDGTQAVRLANPSRGFQDRPNGRSHTVDRACRSWR